MAFLFRSLLIFRSSLFYCFMAFWTFLVGMSGLPLLLLAPSSKVVLVGHVWSKGIIFFLRLCCGVKVRIIGKEALPPAPFIVASKHQSAWDTIIFLAMFHNPVYVLKKELQWLPIYGQYLPRMGMICIDRKGGASALKELIRKAHHALLSKRSIIIFPEGTRTKLGESLPYHPGVAAIYSQHEAAVIPVALNSGLLWSKDSFLKTPGTITLQFLPAIMPGLPRDVFMRKLQDTIEQASLDLLKKDDVT